jgi:hypothetical protein
VQYCCACAVRPVLLDQGGAINDGRLLVCARCRCQVRICSRCDRGQQYCGTRCRGVARRESRRASARRYQQSRRGRHCHAARQRRYRARCRHRLADKKVTHHGSARPRAGVSLMRPDTSQRESSMFCVVVEPSGAHCHFCARALSDFVRLGWRRSSPRRAPALWKRR